MAPNRIKGTRRAAWVAVPAVAALLLTGCGGDDDKDDKSAPTPSVPAAAPTTAAPPTAAAPTPPSAPAAGAPLTGEAATIATNFEKFFDAKTPIADRKKLLEDGETKLSAAVDGLTTNPAVAPLMAQVTAKVKKAEVSGDKAAVTFDVIVGGAPAMPDAPGNAVKQDGTWKVGAKGLCTLLGGLGAAPAECASYQ